MNATACLTLVCLAQTGAIVYALRTLSAVQRRALNGMISKTPQEFALLERTASKPRKAKAPKSPAPIPFGL